MITKTSTKEPQNKFNMKFAKNNNNNNKTINNNHHRNNHNK